ncbi:MAG TPA: glycoside hydrolase domain-containing protein [Candidatus Cybelea sp.]|nr:glycoside hydrolase domain-containing protein [Candidatus Cybelea sp.]
MLTWGIDTSQTADSGLLGIITAHIGKPRFWGRYLTGYPLTAAEIAFLKAENIPILPVYQKTTDSPSALSGGASGRQGTAHGTDAATIASGTFDIPANAGIAIYADIEPAYTPSHYWIEGWIQAITKAGYVPGLYCGSNQPGIIAGMNGVDPALAANLIIWSSEPHDTRLTERADIPTSITPPGFTVGGTDIAVDLWQYCLLYDNNTFDFSVATDRAVSAMWLPA